MVIMTYTLMKQRISTKVKRSFQNFFIIFYNFFFQVAISEAAMTFSMTDTKATECITYILRESTHRSTASSKGKKLKIIGW